MKVLVTGMNGTVAPALAQALRAAGHEVIGWNRALIPPEEPVAVRGFIEEQQPDALCHLGMGSARWAESMARVCLERQLRFLFTSSVSVFSPRQQGPFTVEAPPEPDDDYGRYKLECEQRIRAVDPDARIVRLGWQIGSGPGGNQMLEYLERTHREAGRIEASTQWYPACSFLADTAQSLLTILQGGPSGLCHLDGNPGLDFHAIAGRLRRLHHTDWTIVPVDAPVQNHRMIDPRTTVLPITRIV